MAFLFYTNVKKLLTLLLICFFSASYAQVGTFIKPNNNRGTLLNGVMAAQELYPPIRGTDWTPLRAGALIFDPYDSTTKVFNGATWQAIGANGGSFQLGYDTNFIKAPLNVLSINTKGLNGYNGSINGKDYGLIGDAIYNTSGDLNALSSGADNASKLDALLAQQRDGGKFKGVELFVPAGAYKLPARMGGFRISSNNNTLVGQGQGATIFHFPRTSSLDENAITIGKTSGDADTRLLTRAGLKNATFKTNNTNIINDGLVIDYGEYQTYENLNFEGFYRSAIRMGLWESKFSNITISSSGAGGTATNGVPDYGVIDFDSHSLLPYRDACNNTTFDKLTLSSNYGTHIRASAYANSIVNIKINGLYDETYHGDAGGVDT
jgi:hypothetical protein